MKIIHTADWHIGAYINEHSMLEDQRVFLSRLTEYLRAERPDALIIAGDLYDRSVPPAEAVGLVDAVFSEITMELNIPILAIAGNHDSRARLSFANSLLRPQGLYLEGQVQKELRKVTLSDEYSTVNFYLLPYLQTADVRPLFPEQTVNNLSEAYNLLLSHTVDELNPNERNVLVSHGFFAVSDYIPDTCSESAVGGSDLIATNLFCAFNYTALGHLHAPQSAGLGTARYAGSLLKYSVEEAAQTKSLWCVELEPGKPAEISPVILPPPRDLRILRGEFSELLRSASDSNRSSGDYIFAELTQSEPVLDAVARLRAVYPNILGLKYVNRSWGNTVSGKTVDTLKSKDPAELFDDFYRELTGETLSEEKQNLVRQCFQAAAKEANE